MSIHSFFAPTLWAGVFMLCMQTVQVWAIPKVSAVGSKFFTDDGKQFYIKGIAYQLTPNDPLVDTTQCKLDAALMKDVGANTIRVYHVDPTADHDGCMSAFAAAGIYLFVDLDTFTSAIDQDAPAWNQTALSAYEKVLDTFHAYDNLAGVFVGNEVLTNPNGSWAAPYVKAAARDVKAYRDSKGYRPIPVGYAAADIASLRPMLQNYLACSTNSSDNIDFFSLNAYEWCGASSYSASGYAALENMAIGYSLPIFFSETGCITAPPRDFQDQTAILGPQMSDTWSGAIIYEWIQEANGYGLISYGPSVAATATGANIEGGFSRKGTPTPIAPDFTNLKSRWATLTPSGVALSKYSASAAAITPLPCPASTAGVWNVDPSAPLPTLGQAVVTSTGGSSQGATSQGSGGATTTVTVSTSGSRGSAVAASSSHSSASNRAHLAPVIPQGFSVAISLLVGLAGFMCWWL